MTIDQVFEMSPRAATRAMPIDPRIKADAHKTSARTLRFCNQDSSSRQPETAQTNTAMTKSVGISSDMEGASFREVTRFQLDQFLCQGSPMFDVAAAPA